MDDEQDHGGGDDDDDDDRPVDSDVEIISEGVEASRWAPPPPPPQTKPRSSAIAGPSTRRGQSSDPIAIIPRMLPAHDETLTRPRIRNYGARRR